MMRMTKCEKFLEFFDELVETTNVEIPDEVKEFRTEENGKRVSRQTIANYIANYNKIAKKSFKIF